MVQLQKQQMNGTIHKETSEVGDFSSSFCYVEKLKVKITIEISVLWARSLKYQPTTNCITLTMFCFACVIVTFLNEILTKFNCEADSHSLYTTLSIAVRMSSMRSRAKKHNIRTLNESTIQMENSAQFLYCWFLAATFGYPFGVLNSASHPIVFNKLKRKQQKDEKKNIKHLNSLKANPSHSGVYLICKAIQNSDMPLPWPSV